MATDFAVCGVGGPFGIWAAFFDAVCDAVFDGGDGESMVRSMTVDLAKADDVGNGVADVAEVGVLKSISVCETVMDWADGAVMAVWLEGPSGGSLL